MCTALDRAQRSAARQCLSALQCSTAAVAAAQRPQHGGPPPGPAPAPAHPQASPLPYPSHPFAYHPLSLVHDASEHQTLAPVCPATRTPPTTNVPFAHAHIPLPCTPAFVCLPGPGSLPLISRSRAAGDLQPKQGRDACPPEAPTDREARCHRTDGRPWAKGSPASRQLVATTFRLC